MTTESNLVETDRDTAPQGAVVEWVTAPDETRLRTARWVPAGASRGTVFIANGRTEFIEKYFELIGELLQRGFAVATHDWRGQGLSDRALTDPLKGHVGDFEDFMADFDLVMRSVVEPHCPQPYRVVAHSMGGNITLRYLAQHPEMFAAAIFSAPMWGLGDSLTVGRFVRYSTRILCALGFAETAAPGKSEYKFEGNVLTSSRDRFERFVSQAEAEPRLRLGNPTFGWVAESVGSIDRIHAPGFCESIDVPIHVCTAGSDTLVSLEAQSSVVKRLPNAAQTLVDGSRHEIIMEVDAHRARFLALIDELWQS